MTATDPPEASARDAVARARVFAALGQVLLGALVGFAAVDRFVGWLDRDQGEGDTDYYLRDPYLGWVPRPHFENPETGTRLDRLGLRNPEIQADAPSDEVRVLAVGASRIYGAGGTQQSDVWNALLDARFAAANGEQGVRFLNGGVMGYSVVQACRRAIQLLPLVEPDLLLVAVAPGSQLMLDPSSARNWVRVGEELVPHDIVERWPGWLHRPVLALHTWLLHSSLYVRHRSRARLGDDKKQDAIVKWVMSEDPPPAEIDAMLARTFAELAALGQYARKAGCRVRVLLLPEQYQENDVSWRNFLVHNAHKGAPPLDTPRSEPLAVLRARCAALGFECWDFTPEIELFGTNPGRYLMDVAHWSAAGHQVVARGIYERLSADGLLDLLRAARRSAPRRARGN